ncbi:MAG: AMP-binding protein, partial [Candidatus Binatia bacterium]
MLILDVLACNVAARPQHSFLWHAGRRISYGEFDRLTNRAAHALISRGVAPGDRVTLAFQNSLEWPIAAFGVLKAAAVLHPVNPALGSSELEYVLGHAQPKVILAAAERVAAIAAVAPPTASVLALPRATEEFSG